MYITRQISVEIEFATWRISENFIESWQFPCDIFAYATESTHQHRA